MCCGLPCELWPYIMVVNCSDRKRIALVAFVAASNERGDDDNCSLTGSVTNSLVSRVGSLSSLSSMSFIKGYDSISVTQCSIGLLVFHIYVATLLPNLQLLQMRTVM